MNWDLMALPLGVIVVAIVLALVLIPTIADDRDEEAKARKARIKVLLEVKARLKDQVRGMEPGDERDALVASGRELLAELEALGHNQKKAAASPVSQTRGLMAFVVLTAVVFVVLSVQLVKRESTERMDDAQTTARLAHMKLERAKAALEENPEDLSALKVLVRRAILDADMGTAMNLFMRAESLAPEDSDLEVYASALAIMVGMPDRAFARLDPLLEEDPTHVEALWWKGIAFASMERFDEAKLSLKSVIAHGPGTEEASLAAGVIAEIEVATNVEVHAAGNVEWAEGALLPQGGVLYVAALRAPVDGGPPLAAARFPRFEFPKKFALTAANMPMGGEWPEEFWMRVRIDVDGDPMTKSASDVKTEILGPFERGNQEISIRLGG